MLSLGQQMQEDLMNETGKLGMYFVMHDRLVGDGNLQKSLIHHGANRQTLYQQQLMNSKMPKSSSSKMQTPKSAQSRPRSRADQQHFKSRFVVNGGGGPDGSRVSN